MCVLAFLFLLFARAAALECTLPFEDSTDDIVCEDWHLLAETKCGLFEDIPWCRERPCLRFLKDDDEACITFDIEIDGDDLTCSLSATIPIGAHVVYDGIELLTGKPWSGHILVTDVDIGEEILPIALSVPLFGDVYGDILAGSHQVCVKAATVPDMTVTNFGMMYTAPKCPPKKKSKSNSISQRSKSKRSISKRSRSRSTSKRSKSKRSISKRSKSKRSISKRSRSRSVSKKSKSKSSSKRSTSRSVSRKSKSHSASRRSRSNSASRRSRSNSVSRKSKSRSVSKNSKSNSASKQSRSRSVGKNSRSNSVSRKSRSNSVSRKSKSRSASRRSKSHSKSRSKGKSQSHSQSQNTDAGSQSESMSTSDESPSQSSSHSQSQSQSTTNSKSQTPVCELLVSPYRRGSAIEAITTQCGRAATVYPSETPVGYQPFTGVTITPANGGNISHIEFDYNGTTPLIVWSPSCDILVPVATSVAFTPGACGTTRMTADLVSPVPIISVLFPGGGNATILIPTGACPGPAVSCQCVACGE